MASLRHFVFYHQLTSSSPRYTVSHPGILAPAAPPRRHSSQPRHHRRSLYISSSSRVVSHSQLPNPVNPTPSQLARPPSTVRTPTLTLRYRAVTTQIWDEIQPSDPSLETRLAKLWYAMEFRQRAFSVGFKVAALPFAVLGVYHTE